MKSIAILLLVGSAAASKLYQKDITMSEYEEGSIALQTDSDDAAKAKLSMDDLIKQQGSLMETDAKTIKDYEFML